MDSKETISEIIENAMEKKDRYVAVYISPENGVSVNVYPYEAEEDRWILIDNGYTNYYRCPSCGDVTPYMAPYCRECGEKLKPPMCEEEEKEKERENRD